MGFPMAEHMLAKGNHKLYIWNRTHEKALPLAYPPPQSLLLFFLLHLVEIVSLSTSRVDSLSLSLSLPPSDKGGVVVETPKQAVEASDVVISMLFDYDSIIKSLFAEEATSSLLRGKTLIQMCTLSPQQNEELKKLTNKQGAVFIEAPVLGSAAVAQQGNLQVP